MVRPLQTLRSWWKEEQRAAPERSVILSALVTALVVLTPLLALDIRRRAVALADQQQSVRGRSLEVVATSLAALRRTTRDWAFWDDTYAYITGRLPDYLNRHIASSPIFEDGTVMAVFGPAGDVRFSFGRPADPYVKDRSLIDCVRGNLDSLNLLNSLRALACHAADGKLFLGVVSPISNSTQSVPATGALALLSPFLLSDYGPHLRESLQELERDFVFVRPAQLPPSGEREAGLESAPFDPPFHGKEGKVLALRTQPLLPSLLRSLLEQSLLLLSLLTSLLVFRMLLMLERRQQRLAQRRIERRGGQRIRRTCQELDQLLVHFGLPLAVPSGEDRVLARLLRPPGPAALMAPLPQQAESPLPPTPPPAPALSLPLLGTAPDLPLLDSSALDSSALEVGLRMRRLTDRFQQFLSSARTLALCDPLTQLPNRRYFIEQLELEAEHHREMGKSFAILFVDVDRFKSINDTYGHAVGDGALVAVATRLRSLLRSGDFLARYGGDEFVIVMSFKREDREEAELKAEAHRFATLIAGEFHGTTEVDGVALELSLSIGISLVDPLEADPQAAMKRSDIAMYRAKQHKFSRIVIFDVGDDGSQLDSYQLYVDLLKAVRQRELEVVFQPIVDDTGVMQAVEALVRWQHPNLGAVPPEQMLELAEQHRRMALLGDELLRLALEAYALLPPLDVPCRLSLNLSPSQLTDPGLVQRLTSQLQEHGIESGQVTLELTERSVLELSPLVDANLQALRGLGMRLSLDDFGTGYSSLNLLNTLQPDEVKIDQSFVMAMTTDSYARQIVNLIAGMAPLLGVELVAEGVETPACSTMLQEMGVKLYQGYLVSRPLPAPQLGTGKFAQQASGRP